jgi:aminomethyltransferase
VATGTPLHERTAPLCTSHAWRHWSGYLTPSSYGDYVQPEYAAIRHSAALIDVSPLYKYDVLGRDAARLLDRVMTQDMARLEPGRAVYTPWCDADGAVRQEGTVFRLADEHFRVNAAEPALGWLEQNARALDVRLEDRSQDVAGVALQGPHSRRLLVEAGVTAAEDLAFFRLCDGSLDGVPVEVSRTGYTGDLGYEIWMPAAEATRVWDRLMTVGRPLQVTPCGMLAMDIARLEAGFVLINVDYLSAETALHPDDRTSPFELGLGWAVKLGKPAPFVGRRSLEEEKRRGSRRRLVGLEIDWQPLEEVHLAAGVMPDLPLVPCRESVPVYARDEEGRQVGRVTTRVWSTLLKKYLALATLEAAYAEPGTEVDMEITVHHRRWRAPATVGKPSFYRPERMRA